jgi:hypothetical protein
MRRGRIARLGWLAVMAAATAIAGRAAGEEDGVEPIRLEYHAADGCPDRAAFEARVAGNGNDVWVAYELTAPGDPLASTIQVAHSANGGLSFEAPVQALDRATSLFAWNSSVELEPGGNLDVEYYGGASSGDTAAGLYYVRSTDLGATWSGATLLRAPLTLLDGRGAAWSDAWLGGLGLATTGGSLYTTFTDNSSGVAHVDFARATLPGSGGADAANE